MAAIALYFSYMYYLLFFLQQEILMHMQDLASTPELISCHFHAYIMYYIDMYLCIHAFPVCNYSIYIVSKFPIDKLQEFFIVRILALFV